MAPKKIAQTVLTEGKFYTISAANGKVVEDADYNICLLYTSPSPRD